MTRELIQRGVCACPQQLAGCDPKAPVLLAFSGGADSVALLDMLLEQKRACDFSLILAHVEHGIRGAASLHDRDFCVETAKRLGLEICVRSVDVPTLSRMSGKGLEECAREARYAFFAELMEQKGISVLATAHHADDHLETVLFRMSRGTSCKGLCGIAPARPFADGMLVRPLLGFSKQMLLEHCNAKGLPFVTDETNADTTYTRNRIRTQVIPVLNELFPDVSARAVRMSEDLREDEELLDSLASAFLTEHTSDGSLDLNALAKVHGAIARRVLFQWALQQTGMAPEAIHLRQLQELARSKDASARVALPGGASAYECGERLCLMPTRMPVAEEYSLPLSVGDCAVEGTSWRITVQKIEDDIKIHNLSTAPCIILCGDFDIIKKDVLWRNRREGDTLLQNGMHRKLRRLYAQKQIPLELRRTVPLLCRNGEILWAPFVGAADGFLQNENAQSGSKWLLQVHLKKDQA